MLTRMVGVVMPVVVLLGAAAQPAFAAPWHLDSHQYRMPLEVAPSASVAPAGARVTVDGVTERLIAARQAAADGSDLRVVWQPTSPGRALQADAGTFMRIPADLGAPPEFTVEFWLRLQPTDLGAGGGGQRIVDTEGWSLTRTATSMCAGATCAPLPAAGEWHHVALSRTAAATTIALDGAVAASGAPISAMLGSNLTLGASRFGNTSLRGDIDEVRISSAARAASPPGVSPLEADASTLALYHLDESTAGVTPDASGNGHGAMVATGGRFAWRSGISGSAVDLDGSGSYVRVDGDLGTPDELTLEMWFMPTAYEGGWSYLADGRQAAGSWWFADNGSICFDGARCAPRPTLNEWHHVAVTATATETRIFLDGNLIGTWSATSRVLGDRLVIGARHSLDEVFRGAIDEVRISDSVRYAGPFTPAARHEVDSSTLLLLHLDEASGATTLDASPHRHPVRLRTPNDAWTGGVVASAPPMAPRTIPVMVDSAGDATFQLQEVRPADAGVKGEYFLYTGTESAAPPSDPFVSTASLIAFAGPLEARTPPRFAASQGSLGSLTVSLSGVLGVEGSAARCTFGWGDGAIESIIGPSATHTYRSNGPFDVDASCSLLDGRTIHERVRTTITNADDAGPVITPGRVQRTTRAGARYRFEFADDGTGIASMYARFRGSLIPLSADGIVDLRGKADGLGTLLVVAIDRNGNRSAYRTRLRIDGTAPTVHMPASRFVLGPRVKLRFSDRGAGVSGRYVYGMAPKLGWNAVSVSASDRAGNATRTRVIVDRRPSLANPRLNRGLGAGMARFEIRDAFRFRWRHDPWYGRTMHSPPLVREVQWRLQLFGYLPRAVPRSGRLDMATIEAVKQFQRAHGIPAIATVGPRTRAALDRKLLAHGS